MEKINDQQDSTKNVSKPTITIGYYNLRGKAQVPRLLCQYLKVDYKDKLFSLEDWLNFKKQKTKSWLYSDIPFLQQGGFILTQAVPISIYIITRFGDIQLLGRNIQDSTLINMYVWTIQTMTNVISINSVNKTQQQLDKLKQTQWNNVVQPRILKYEKLAHQNNFYLGYLTLIDFSLYELARYLEMIFPGKVTKFKKIMYIKNLVYQLPQIYQYENSTRAVTVMCPSKLLLELKNKEMKLKNQKKIRQKQKKEDVQA